MLQSFVRRMIEHRLAVMVVTLVVLLAALFSMRNLHIEIDPAKILPQSHPFVASRGVLEGIFGEKYAVVVAITPKSGDALQPAVLEKVRRISDGLAATDYVVRHNVLSLTSARAKAIAASEDGIVVSPLVDTADPGGAATRQAILDNPVFDGVLLSPDRRTTAVIALFDKGPYGYWQVLDQIEPVIDRERDASVDIHVSGHAQVLGTIERFSGRMLFFVPLAILVIGLIHLEAFRSLQGLLLPLVTANIALIAGLGVMGAAGIPLDVFNATTPILILAVAAGHAVQILKRYYEEFDRLAGDGMAPHDANREAIVTALVRVGPFMLAAGVIAALGFFSLMVFDIATVRTFGFFTGVGIAAAIIVEFTFIPALRSYLKPPAPRVASRDRPSVWLALVERIHALSSEPRRVLAAALALVVVLGLGATQVSIENSNKSNMGPSLQIRQDDAFINTQLAGTQIIYFMVDAGAPGAALSPPLLSGIAALQQMLAAEPLVGKSVAITDFLRRMHVAMGGDPREHAGLPATQELAAQYMLLYGMNGDPTDFDSVLDAEQRRANIKVFIKDDSSIAVEALIRRTQSEANRLLGGGVRVDVGGGVAEAAALNEVLIRDKLLNVAQISAVVLVLAALLFRAVVAGIYVLVPLAFAVLANFAVLGYTGIPLNIPTSLISAMAVGIGADYAIYLLSRIREEARSAPLEEAIHRAMRSAGVACLYVATAVACGYGLLVFSLGFRVHQWMGLLITSAMIVSALATLFLLPALVRIFRPAFVLESRS